ncbi:MAG: glutathione S-transferase family protein [Deltaproteobacteria bacterium]
MITIYGRATSANVQLVMWTIAELGLEHHRYDFGGAFGKTDTPEFAVMNPNRLVPVMQDGDLTMFESAAIMRYLCARYASDSFWPKDAEQRGRLDQWAEWGKISFATGLTPLFMNLVRTAPSKRNSAAIAKAEADAARLAEVLENHIGKRPWMAGETFTFADIGVGYYLYRYFTMPFSRSATPNLDAYYERLTSRPAYRSNVMISYDSLYVRD